VTSNEDPQTKPIPILLAEEIGRSFATPEGPLAILRGCSLRLGPGESAAITGPSGVGKTTLLNILGTLDRPTGGRLAICGTDPAALSPRELASLRCARLGFVFQDHHLLPQCSVVENVLLPALASSTGVTDAHLERAHRLLERVGLGERAGRRPETLSGGERQRAAVVRALINEPDLLLCDEPTGNLDSRNAGSLRDLLLDLVRGTARALVVVTHDLALARRFGAHLRLEEGGLKE
jgi:lipoprotein-releasing system ATP-binding protein